MFSVVLFSAGAFIVTLVALLFAVRKSGALRQRARAAEKQNTANRKAHEIQNRVAVNSRFRERVRRYFDDRT